MKMHNYEIYKNVNHDEVAVNNNEMQIFFISVD